nr:DUF2142 domain-containing protein [uncultured Eisenbergiella sp.]
MKNKGKWFGILFIILLILFAGWRIYLSDNIPDHVTLIKGQPEEQVIRNLTDDYIVEQSFSCDWDFDYITLDFSDHDQSIAGKTTFIIYDNSGEVVKQEEYHNYDIHYNQPVQLSFLDVGGGRAEQTYTVRILESGTEKTALGIYGYQVTGDNNAAIVNGDAQAYCISIGVHKYTNLFRILIGVQLLICFLGIAGVIFLCMKEDITDEKLFLSIAVPFGICMLLLICDNNVHDQQAHYAKAYQAANFLLGVGEYDGPNCTYMRSEDLRTGQDKDYSRNQGRETWVALTDWTWFKQKDGMEVSTSFYTPANGGTLLAYLPNSIGLVIGRILNLGAYPMLLLSKIIGFTVYLAICYFAIKRTPILKPVIAFTAALPVSLFNAVGITYDTMTLAAALLMCSHIFIWWKRNLKRSECIALIISAVFVGACKGGIFLPLILLLLLVPYKRWKLDKKRIIIGICFLSIGIAAFLYKYGGYLVSALQTGSILNEPSEKYGSGYCFTHPLSFLKMVIFTIIEAGDRQIGQLIGYRIGWIDKDIEWTIVFLFLLLIWIAGIRRENEEELRVRNRITVLFLLIAEYIGIYIVLMSDTLVGAEYVYGVQGRYFVALIPLLVLAVRENSVVRNRKNEKKVYIYFSVVQLIYMFSFSAKCF